VILAGPNGAGKSTSAAVLLPGTLGIGEFINADDIARELSPLDVEAAAISAGRIMLARLRELAGQRANFAFETTLASRSFAPWLRDLKGTAYGVHLIYIWLPSDSFAAERVRRRVLAGGHNIPRDTIRRRYAAGLRNFCEAYESSVSSWRIYDGSRPIPRLVATRLEPKATKVCDETTWARIQRQGQP
jgi:predicted ABC-type ATPase